MTETNTTTDATITNVKTVLKQGYIVNGLIFNTAAEARDYIRRPQVEAAVAALVNGDENFKQFLMTNQEEIEKSFEVGVINRVTKLERTKLCKAYDYIAEVLKDDPKAKFITDNLETCKESFRWPAVKRLSAEEKAASSMASLSKLADEAVAQWIVTNKEPLLEAFNAGIEKRAAPAGTGLAEYLAAKKAGPEALAAYQAAKAAAKAK